MHHSTEIRGGGGGGGITEQSAPNPVPKEEDEETFKSYRLAKAAPILSFELSGYSKEAIINCAHPSGGGGGAT